MQRLSSEQKDGIHQPCVCTPAAAVCLRPCSSSISGTPRFVQTHSRRWLKNESDTLSYPHQSCEDTWDTLVGQTLVQFRGQCSSSRCCFPSFTLTTASSSSVGIDATLGGNCFGRIQVQMAPSSFSCSQLVFTYESVKFTLTYSATASTSGGVNLVRSDSSSVTYQYHPDGASAYVTPVSTRAQTPGTYSSTGGDSTRIVSVSSSAGASVSYQAIPILEPSIAGSLRFSL